MRAATPFPSGSTTVPRDASGQLADPIVVDAAGGGCPRPLSTAAGGEADC